MNDTSKIKTFIVDDSATVRRVLGDMLDTAPDIEVIGAAQNPVFARRHMEKSWPDVIILDIEMPQMDGLTFLKQIMAERPTAVVMCSTLAESGSQTALEALSYGAVEVIAKPVANVKNFLQASTERLLHAVRAAASADLSKFTGIAGKTEKLKPAPVKQSAPKLSADVILSKSRGPVRNSTADKVIAIGTSTGGVNALGRILPELPVDIPGIVIVQHMPENYTRAFANRLNNICKVTVKEAEDNERVLPGHVFIAPGGKHLLVKAKGPHVYVCIKKGPPVSRHCPSVDVLFRSVSKEVGRNALGIIMTGMGDDGAMGLKEMYEAGAHTLGQDEASCVVYGMPAAANKLGAVEHEIPLDAIPDEIVAFDVTTSYLNTKNRNLPQPDSSPTRHPA